ncbi:unnamed protein product [Brassica rapa subsp. trilocularis]
MSVSQSHQGLHDFKVTSKKKNDLIKCRFLSPAISEAIPRVSASPSTALRHSRPQAPVDVHSFQSLNNQALSPDIALEEGEIPFQPSPAALKKARRIKRQEALLAAASPSSAVSLLFSSIRGKSLGRDTKRA